MQKHIQTKRFILLSTLLLTAAWGNALGIKNNDGYNPITVKEACVQGVPRSSSIQASVNGHYLSVVFLENLGQVTVEVSRVNGGETHIESTPTPNGVNFYIFDTGSYIVTFTLSNGDEYYGEFEVTE